MFTEGIEIDYLDSDNKDYFEIMHEEDLILISLKREWKRRLKSKINVQRLFACLNETVEYWKPLGIIRVVDTGELIPGYSGHKTLREEGVKSGHLYLVQNSDVKGLSHEAVWQTTGYLGDDYSGILLFPLNDGTYFKVEYTC